MSDKKGKKKQTKRSKEKYPSLKRNLNSKVRQEYIDYDYINGVKNPETDEVVMRALTDEEKQFLEDFNSEFYNASVGKQGDEGEENRFHKSRKLVKECQDANNARQRDMYGRVRNKVGATKLLNYEDSKGSVDEYLNKNLDYSSYENALIDFLDHAESADNGEDDSDDNS